jgi:hypothetical protein
VTEARSRRPLSTALLTCTACACIRAAFPCHPKHKIKIQSVQVVQQLCFAPSRAAPLRQALHREYTQPLWIHQQQHLLMLVPRRSHLEKKIPNENGNLLLPRTRRKTSNENGKKFSVGCAAILRTRTSMSLFASNVFIRKHLDDLNRSAGIQHVPGQHNYCVDTYGENFRFSFQCTMVRFLFHSYFVSHFIFTFHLCFRVQKFSDSLFFI